MKTIKQLLAVALIALSAPANGQIIYEYHYDPSGAPHYVDPHITAANLTFENVGSCYANPGTCDSGFVLRGNIFNYDPDLGYFNMTGAGGVVASITPQSGYQLNLTSITITAARLDGGPETIKFGMNPNQLGWISGEEGGLVNFECDGISYPTTATGNWDFEDFNSLSPVKFKLVGFNDLGHGSGFIFNIKIFGTVTPAQTIPVITAFSPPGPLITCDNETVQLSVTASGTPAPNIQWQNNNTDIPGATSSIYVLPIPLPGGNYRAVVSNIYGSMYIPSLEVFPYPAPIVTAGPDQNICGTNEVNLNGSSNGNPDERWWETSGDGNFSDPYILNPVYTAGSSDLAHGSVELWLRGERWIPFAPYFLCAYYDTMKIIFLPYMPGIITTTGGLAKICPGETRTYTTQLFTNVTYNWTVPTGAIINSGQGTNSINVTYNNSFTTGGTISVVKATTCGLSPPRTLTVNRNNPAATITTNGGPTTFCSGTNPLILTANAGTGLTYQWKKGNNNITCATNQSYVPTTTSPAYKVVVTNAPGCSKISAIVSVTVNPLPAATITAQGPTTFCAGDSVVLQANIGSGLNYQWKKGMNIILGATLQNYTAKTAGTYRVIVTNANSCSRTSSSKVVTVNCKTGNSGSEATSMEIFPNPTYGMATLKFISEENRNGDLLITDITGRTVIHEQITISAGMNEHIIDMGNFVKGIYFLKIQTTEGEMMGKIVRE